MYFMEPIKKGDFLKEISLVKCTAQCCIIRTEQALGMFGKIIIHIIISFVTMALIDGR